MNRGEDAVVGWEQCARERHELVCVSPLLCRVCPHDAPCSTHNCASQSHRTPPVESRQRTGSRRPARRGGRGRLALLMQRVLLVLVLVVVLLGDALGQRQAHASLPLAFSDNPCPRTRRATSPRRRARNWRASWRSPAARCPPRALLAACEKRLDVLFGGSPASVAALKTASAPSAPSRGSPAMDGRAMLGDAS